MLSALPSENTSAREPRGPVERPPSVQEPVADGAAAGTGVGAAAATEGASGGWRSRLRRGARRVADWFPWTPLGLGLAVAAAVALVHFAYARLDLVLLVVGYGAAALAILSSIAVVLTALWIGRDLRRLPTERVELALETHQPRRTRFQLRRRAWLPLVRVRWMAESPAALEVRPRQIDGLLREDVTAHLRGRRTHLRRRIVVEDVFGLARLGLRHTSEEVTTTLPHKGALKHLPSLLATSGGDDWPHPLGVANGDRLELRRYAPGDPARFIHWKVFARTRKLVVRLPERALSRAHRTVAYLVAGSGDSASAAAARVAIESAAFGDDWAFGADGASPGQPATSVAAAREMIVSSVAHRAAGAVGLERFLAAEETRGPASIVLFVPPEPGAWLPLVVHACKRRPGRVRLVVAVDGLAEPRRWPWWRSMFSRPPAEEASSATALETVLTSLHATRGPVLVVDRRTGRALGEAHRRAVTVKPSQAKRAAA